MENKTRNRLFSGVLQCSKTIRHCSNNNTVSAGTEIGIRQAKAVRGGFPITTKNELRTQGRLVGSPFMKKHISSSEVGRSLVHMGGYPIQLVHSAIQQFRSPDPFENQNFSISGYEFSG
jgi:hypothetical protein